ncbi:MAG: hypothetical protein AAF436_15915 [Myxococcota bacterium]
MRRTGIHLLVILSLVVGTAAAVDAAVVTDRERMEAFVEAVTGEVSSRRIDSALQYADPTRVSMDLVHHGRRHRYNDRNASKLQADAREALAPLAGSHVSLLQEDIHLDGESARIALRLRTPEGFANTVFDLRRENDEWLLRRVTVN